jgi:hypothetical protein
VTPKYTVTLLQEPVEDLRRLGDFVIERELASETPDWTSLSGILCAGRSMTKRSMYANQQEDDDGGYGRCGGDAVDPQGTH